MNEEKRRPTRVRHVLARILSAFGRASSRRTNTKSRPQHALRAAFCDELRRRCDLAVDENEQRWLITIIKGQLTCEIVVPKSVFEWFVSVKRSGANEALWSDWDDYYGSPPEQLEAQMVKGIAGFVERAMNSDFNDPIPMDEADGG